MLGRSCWFIKVNLSIKSLYMKVLQHRRESLKWPTASFMLCKQTVWTWLHLQKQLWWLNFFSDDKLISTVWSEIWNKWAKIRQKNLFFSNYWIVLPLQFVSVTQIKLSEKFSREKNSGGYFHSSDTCNQTLRGHM